MSHATLAAKVRKLGGDITPSGIVHLEGRDSRSTRASRELAMALGVNHDWLVSGTGPQDADRSIDRKLRLLPPEDFDDVYDDLSAIVDRRLERLKTTR